jgi:CelD/BcsL family acetyltransferase involved in cellulose biosynthesis
MLRELLRSAGSGLELWCVRSSGRLVAAELAVAWQHRLLGLWTGFDASYPYVGTYAVILALQEAFQRKLEFFDFLQGDETYKLQWANDERTVDQSIHARLTPPGLAGYAATRARWRLAASPRVRELAARLRSSWNRSQRGDGSGSSFD